MAVLRRALMLGSIFAVLALATFARAQIFAALPLGTFARAQDDQSISSDGTAIKALESQATISPGYAGTGQEVMGAAPESAVELAELLSKRPVSAPVGIESIIGTDDRVLVNPTTSYPYRAVVLVTFSAGRCTGWLISKDTVATAGHCVHQGSGGARGFYPVSGYRVYPGRNGSDFPYGGCTARRLHTVAGWANRRLDTSDYGAIKLNCTAGTTTGWFGFSWTRASLFNFPTTISGYPGDKPLTQWLSTDRVRVSRARRVFYQNDTIGGMSGSPVYYNRPGCGICSMAIHAYGTYNGPPFRTNNHGTRITQAVFNNLVAWKNAP